MNILYYGMSGSAADPTKGWIFIIIGIIVIVGGVIIECVTGFDEDWLVIPLIICIALIIIGIPKLFDTRSPYITATLDDTVSFTEIQDKYDLRKKEGQLYTFEVLNVDINEWEQLVKEKNN